jgi:hypothetical protein
MRTCLTGILMAAGLLASPPAPAACNIPIAFAIGEVDRRFDLSRAEFERAIHAAIRVWEDAAGRDLFVQRAGADLRINLVYSERQRATEQIQALDERTGSLRERIRALDQRLQAARDRLEREAKGFQRRAEAFRADKRKFDRRVRQAKEQGASQAELEALRERQRELQQRARDLQAEQRHLEGLEARVNELKVRANSLVIEHNKRVRQRDRIARPGTEFRQGYYKRAGAGGEQITIRQFSTTARLRFALAHELGHALGLGHLDNPQAVMHYRSRDQGSARLALTETDRRALREACGSRR